MAAALSLWLLESQSIDKELHKIECSKHLLLSMSWTQKIKKQLVFLIFPLGSQKNQTKT